ncbi:MAG: hypothetical protein IIA33_11545 [Planctomycetes bacterium]|nr:hypothetical protein [Planctomycetota bacterium]
MSGAPESYEAEDDLRTIIQARKIEADSGRMARAKNVATRKKDEFSLIEKEFPATTPRGFNGAVRDSKMKR